MRIFVATAILAGTAFWLMSANASQFLEGRITRSDVMESPSVSRLVASEYKLGKAFNQLMTNLDETGKRKLSSAQRAWKKYSQAECDYTSTASPAAPIHPMSYNECLLVMNVERTADLRHQMQWLELLDIGIGKAEQP